MTPLQFDRPPWTSGDVQNLRLFLASETGSRFIGHLAYSRPEYKTFSSVEERAIQSGLVEGYEKCVERALELTKKPIEIL
jgi:hypothetical protein